MEDILYPQKKRKMNNSEISVKLIVSLNGDETSMNVLVKHGEEIKRLNEKHFGSHVGECSITWIYYGRTLTEVLPTSVVAGSVIHVYV